MTRLFLIALLALPLSLAAQKKTVEVKPHVTKQGVYVPPHARTAPNGTKMDNWNTKGNVNPRTGKVGTEDPYALPKPRKR